MLRRRLAALIAVTSAAAVTHGGTAVAQQPIEGLGQQQRLTVTGNDGETNLDALDPAVAHNPEQNQFLLVWEAPVPGTTRVEIFGQLLDANGNVAGVARQLTEIGATNPMLRASNPEVLYSTEIDRYVIGFEADEPGGVQEIHARLVDLSGQAVGNAIQVSDMDPATGPGRASDPVMAIDTDASPDDVRFAYGGNGTGNVDNAEIYSRGLDVDLTNPLPQIQISSHTSGTPAAPAIAHVPGVGYALAWHADETGSSEYEVFAELIEPDGGPVAAQEAVSAAPGANEDSLGPEIAYRQTSNELVVTFTRDTLRPDTTVLRNQVYVQRLLANSTLDEVAAEAQVTALNEGVSPSHALAYDPSQDRHLIVFSGAAVSGKNEIFAQALDGNGNALATDDAQISVTPPAENDNGDATLPAVASSGGAQRWITAWQADSLVAPLTDNEFEIYGRLVGENFDRDYDGSAIPADCDDGNAAVRPGAADAFDNGVDEDCDGVSAENFDRDGDGSPRPADCDDGNPFLRPGANEIAGNGVDEDCSGADAALPPPPPPPPTLTNAGLTFQYAFRGRNTRITRLLVTRARKGMTIRTSCRGRGCPRRLRPSVNRTRVRRNGTVNLTRLFRRASLRPRARVEIRITESGRIGKVFRFTMRARKAPRRSQLCLQPGRTRPTRCPR